MLMLMWMVVLMTMMMTMVMVKMMIIAVTIWEASTIKALQLCVVRFMPLTPSRFFVCGEF